MALKEEFKKSGDWLFRWRSYLPLFLIAFFLVACRDFNYPYGSPLLDKIWKIFCLFISLSGLGIRALTIGYVPRGTSGRGTKELVAKALNTAGMYSVVRHPLYLGNLIIWLGVSMLPRIWWFSVIVLLVFWLYYERIMFAEEYFLEQEFGESFLGWAEKTPAFIPRWKNWVKPSLSFSFKNALKREYSTFFAIIATFTVLELIAEIFLKGRLVLEPMWIIIFSIGLTIYLIVRIIKKRTTLLDVEGR
jgi:protein-S-isoprenylcysteine O-methyltransferase Ste14